jgi:hypothetical protein
VRSILHYDGLPIDAMTIVEAVRSREREEVAVR